MKEISKRAFKGEFDKTRHLIPKSIINGEKPISRCCVYKEREIVFERVNYAVDEITKNSNIIEIIDIACDECPSQRYKVTDSCRGCLAHRCLQACPVNAIDIVNGKASINASKCISCGKCKEVCPYDAIADVLRPCMKACLSKAIEIRDDNKVEINRDLCTSCGTCVYQCPFGAITDRSEILPVIKALKEQDNHVYAVIAPSIASQYHFNINKIVSAIKQIGFKDVIEASLGADLVAYYETKEFIEKVINNKQTVLMTSCCPSFVYYVKKHYPQFKPLLSSMVSPMIAVARLIRKTDKLAKIVFIGPCTSKKLEEREEDLQGDIDYVLTFEELEALIDAKNINIETCEDSVLDNASYYGRLFARSGGVKDAVVQALKEMNKDIQELKPIVCNGIDEVEKALKLVKYKKNTFNFIEGMSCKGGCIGGAVCLTHKENKYIDQYAKLAIETKIHDSLRIFENMNLNLHRNQ